MLRATGHARMVKPNVGSNVAKPCFREAPGDLYAARSPNQVLTHAAALRARLQSS